MTEQKTSLPKFYKKISQNVDLNTQNKNIEVGEVINTEVIDKDKSLTEEEQEQD